MFTIDEKAVLLALKDFAQLLRPLDGGRYTNGYRADSLVFEIDGLL
jgi:hypothetical protein